MPPGIKISFWDLGYRTVLAIDLFPYIDTRWSHITVGIVITKRCQWQTPYSSNRTAVRQRPPFTNYTRSSLGLCWLVDNKPVSQSGAEGPTVTAIHQHPVLTAASYSPRLTKTGRANHRESLVIRGPFYTHHIHYTTLHYTTLHHPTLKNGVRLLRIVVHDGGRVNEGKLTRPPLLLRSTAIVAPFLSGAFHRSPSYVRKQP